MPKDTRKIETIDDLWMLTNREIQRLNRACTRTQWAIALQDVPALIKKHVLANIAKRAEELVLEEMAVTSPTPAETNEAKEEILQKWYSLLTTEDAKKLLRENYLNNQAIISPQLIRDNTRAFVYASHRLLREGFCREHHDYWTYIVEKLKISHDDLSLKEHLNVERDLDAIIEKYEESHPAVKELAKREARDLLEVDFHAFIRSRTTSKDCRRLSRPVRTAYEAAYAEMVQERTATGEKEAIDDITEFGLLIRVHG